MFDWIKLIALQSRSGAENIRTSEHRTSQLNALLSPDSSVAPPCLFSRLHDRAAGDDDDDDDK